MSAAPNLPVLWQMYPRTQKCSGLWSINGTFLALSNGGHRTSSWQLHSLKDAPSQAWLDDQELAHCRFATRREALMAFVAADAITPAPRDPVTAGPAALVSDAAGRYRTSDGHYTVRRRPDASGLWAVRFLPDPADPGEAFVFEAVRTLRVAGHAISRHRRIMLDRAEVAA